jgi:hypothetical protein
VTQEKDPASPAAVPRHDKGFEDDVYIEKRFVAFSSELVRLSLLALGAFSLALTEVELPQSPNPPARWDEFAVLVFLGVAAGTGLLHRYFAADALVHLTEMRRTASEKKKRDEHTWMQLDFRRASALLLVSASSLILGVLTTLPFLARVSPLLQICSRVARSHMMRSLLYDPGLVGAFAVNEHPGPPAHFRLSTRRQSQDDLRRVGVLARADGVFPARKRT